MWHTDNENRNIKVPLAASPGLTLDQMKAFVIKHFEDFVNNSDSDAALRNFSEDFLDHDETHGVAIGPLKAKLMMEATYKLWPDIKVQVQDILAEGDKVMVRNQWSATDTASGNKIEFHGFVVWRFANKKIVERWATLSTPTTTK